MTEQITLKELLKLVSVMKGQSGDWFVANVLGEVYGNVEGNVCGTINGREWQYVETPKDKLKRLIEEDADKEQLLEAFNQLEDNK